MSFKVGQKPRFEPKIPSRWVDCGISHRILELAELLCDELEKLPTVTVHMPPEGEPWCGIVSFTLEGIRPQAIEAALGAKGIAVRAGLHCAPWAHRWLGTLESGGTVRVSLSFHNCRRDIESFIRANQTFMHNVCESGRWSS